jgi:deazaflavin-dependent oxidoreductase (nitroreductase family)
MSFNDRIIDEFRANGGIVANFGSELVLLHTVGARSGSARVNPVLAIADGDGWVVIASAAGSTKHPAWYFNLVAQPLISVETPGGIVEALATELEGDEWQAAWQKFLAKSSAFAGYRTRSEGRDFPIFRLTPR